MLSMVLAVVGLLLGICGLLIYRFPRTLHIDRIWSLRVLFLSCLTGLPGPVMAIVAAAKPRGRKGMPIAALIVGGLHIVLGLSFWFPLGLFLWGLSSNYHWDWTWN